MPPPWTAPLPPEMLKITDSGTNNRIDIAAQALARASGSVTLHGSNNLVSIAAPVLKLEASIEAHNNATIIIGENCSAGKLRIFAADGASVAIGKFASFNGSVRLLLHEAQAISIGDGCLIGSDVDITVSDMHAIIDLATGLRINPARSVTIGDRVWIGQRATILKGVSLGAGSIVGAGSVVTSDVPPNTLVAGNPARLIRQGVSWNAKLS